MFLEKVLEFLDAQMPAPTMYGWFHLLMLALIALAAALLCKLGKNHSPDMIRRVILTNAILVAIFEVYKQINFTFSVGEHGITADYAWYAFPFQFCDTPMYAGLLMSIFRKGRLHDALCAYLATYAVFAGLAVMAYPVSIYTTTIGINLQTSLCHGSMLVIGAYLYSTGYVQTNIKTLLRAIPVFVTAVCVAMALNELAFFSGLLETDVFNMFFISPYCDPSLPVYSIIQGMFLYPYCLLIYIIGFTAAAGIILLFATAIRKMVLRSKIHI